jgi:hypothetical protein
MFNFDLSQDIERHLLNTPQCTEYAIITHLQSLGRLGKNVLSSPLSLFRCHFLIHNALYRLKYLALSHKQYNISISSMSITLNPYDTCPTTNTFLPDTSELGPCSKLGLFYLDLTQLNQTQEQDVNNLLDQFWKKFYNPQQKNQALTTLKIHPDEQVNIDFKSIKKQYRRLVMQHHPDRGGDANKLIAIQQAMQCLEHYYT